jgi:hypothetical protein
VPATPENQARPGGARGKAADLASAFGRLAAVPAEPEPEPERKPASRARRQPQRDPIPPPQQDKDAQFPKRLNLPLPEDMMKDLQRARLEDGTEATARIRAMIWYWQEDERFRARVDRKAREKSIRGR